VTVRFRNWLKVFQGGQDFTPEVLSMLTQLEEDLAAGGGGGVQSVSAADDTITVGGTAQDVTLAVNGGSQPLIDLGLLDVTDCNSGPVTVYEPDDGDYVIVRHSLAGFVAHDVDDGDGELGIGYLGNPGSPFFGSIGPGLLLAAGDDGEGDLSGGTAFEGQFGDAAKPLPINDGRVITAMVTGGDDTFPINAPVGVWQASHAYAEGALIFGGDGQWYRADSAGTSDDTEPAWPGRTLTVTDNDFDWLGVGIPATVGAIHLYALRLVPAAP